MSESVEAILARLGHSLPTQPPSPAGAYKAAVAHGDHLYISGQFPLRDGAMVWKGRVGDTLSVEEGRQAAALAAVNVLAQINRALGGFERLATLLRVDGYIASAPDCFDQPKVLDGASELFAAALGPKAGHARTAFAVTHLPLFAPIELVVTAAIEPA